MPRPPSLAASTPKLASGWPLGATLLLLLLLELLLLLLLSSVLP
jgi:hypothetical protein